MFLPPSARGLEISTNWYSAPLSTRGLEFFCWLYNFFSLPHEIWSDIPLLFRTRFGMVLFLFRSRFEADPWFTDLFALLDPHLKASQTWFCFGLTLESQSNSVLFWSYTWKPVKLGSVLVLHWKASQTWFFKFCHMFSYLDLPFTASLVALLTLSRLST